MQIADLTGRSFGKLVVLSRAASKNHRSAWNVRCACGQLTTALKRDLIEKKVASCGCDGRKTNTTCKSCGQPVQKRLFVKVRCDAEKCTGYGCDGCVFVSTDFYFFTSSLSEAVASANRIAFRGGPGRIESEARP
jgi:hypothetical protein